MVDPGARRQSEGNRLQDERYGSLDYCDRGHARRRPITPVPQRQLDDWRTALLNNKCQKMVYAAPKSQVTSQRLLKLPPWGFSGRPSDRLAVP